MGNIDIAFVLLQISLVLLVVMFFYICRKSNKTQLHNIFLVNLGLLFVWCIAIMLQTYFKDFVKSEHIIFFDYIAYIGICYTPVTLLFTGMIFAHTKIKATGKHFALLIVPTLSIVILWTNDFHHLFYKKYSTIISEVVYGQYFIFHAIYSYSCILICLYYFLFYSKKNSGFFSKQALLVFLGFILPFIINILFTLNIVSLPIYSTPMSFIFLEICLIFATFKYSLLNIVPIAMQKVVDLISDSFIVLNEEMKIIDYNKTLLNTLGFLFTIKRNSSFFDVLDTNTSIDIEKDKFIQGVHDANTGNKTVVFETIITKGESNRYFSVEITPITSYGDHIGTIILLKDITEHKKSLQIIKDNQERLVERERLASLGQMVGGIAHNLKTPIMSISGGLEALKDLIDEYSESIEDTNVTIEDHHEIAQEMRQWIDKIKPHCAYMSDIISAIKGQAVQLSDSSTGSFVLDELINRVEVLMRHELKIRHCRLNLILQANKMSTLTGEINSLIQAINNIIVNAIHSYDDNNGDGDIDFIISENDNNIEFAVKDYGKGIPKDIQNRLFKEMVTTKGKNGTGLGLYMSYSTIKGRFGGNMWFESEENKGTTFYVSVPKAKVEVYQGG